MLHQFWPHLLVEKLDQTFMFDPQVLAVTVPTYMIHVWIAIRFTRLFKFFVNVTTFLFQSELRKASL